MLQFLSPKRFVPQPVLTTLPVDTTASATGCADTPESIPCECGWFDSSFDLRLGLMVQEVSCSGPAWQMASPSPVQ